jgi:hypothetical protein
MADFCRRPEGQVFGLFDHPYRWEGHRLVRVADDEARCVETLHREPYGEMRCTKLVLHDGKHSASPE